LFFTVKHVITNIIIIIIIIIIFVLSRKMPDNKSIRNIISFSLVALLSDNNASSLYNEYLIDWQTPLAVYIYVIVILTVCIDLIDFDHYYHIIILSASSYSVLIVQWKTFRSIVCIVALYDCIAMLYFEYCFIDSVIILLSCINMLLVCKSYFRINFRIRN
jgi:hypothetical protein